MEKKNNTIEPIAPIDQEKVDNVYTKNIVTLEILKLKTLPESSEEAQEIYDKLTTTKTYVIDDLSAPYVIRLAYTEKKTELKSIDPEFIPESDKYELSESIQEILKENGFPIIESNFPETE